MTVALILGLVCGFVGSIPIAGPTGVLIVERALHGRGREAIRIALGSTIAEIGYALLAFLGMTAALSEFPWMIPASRLLGALILIALGLHFALRKRPPAEHHEGEKPRGGGAFVLGLVMTGINPTLLATWSAVVTILHGTSWLRVEALDAFPFALGAGAGMAGWFVILVWLLGKFRERMSQRTLSGVVRVLGWILVAAGLALLVNVLVGWLR